MPAPRLPQVLPLPVQQARAVASGPRPSDARRRFHAPPTLSSNSIAAGGGEWRLATPSIATAPVLAQQQLPAAAAAGAGSLDTQQLAAAAVAAVAAVQRSGAASAAAAAAAAAAAVAATGAAAGAPPGPASGTDGGGSSSSGVKVAVRVIPELRSFKSVAEVMRWASVPRFGGKSVLELESAGDIEWRRGQKNSKVVWRKVSLVIRRVSELKAQGPRVLTEAAAIAATDAERERLRLPVPSYSKHLEREVAARNKAAAAGPSSGDDGGD